MPGKKHKKRTNPHHGSDHDGNPANRREGEDAVVYTVRIQPNPDDENRYTEEKTCRTQQLTKARNLNIISGIGVGVAFLALVGLAINAIVSHEQLKAMILSNKINQISTGLAYRPYIGVDGVRVSFLSRGPNGGVLASPGPLKQTESLVFKPMIKNFGSIPGEKYAGSWRIFYGSTEVPGTKIPDTPITLYPTQIMAFDAQFTGDRYRAVVSGEIPLVIEVTVNYDGPTDNDGQSKHYHECVKEQFDPPQSGFLNLGACSH